MICADVKITEIVLKAALSNINLTFSSKTSIEREMKDKPDTHRSASYLYLRLVIDSNDRLMTKHYDRKYYLNVPVMYSIYIYITTFQQRLLIGIYIYVDNYVDIPEFAIPLTFS